MPNQGINYSEYIGKKINYLTVLSLHKEGKKYYFICRCDCGRKHKRSAHRVVHGLTKTCGSLKCRQQLPSHINHRIDLTGRKFGRLTVIKVSHLEKGKSRKGYNVGRLFWLCQCECGNTHATPASDLLTGGTTSCGCFREDNLHKFLVEGSTLKNVLVSLGYRKDGRKIGVTILKWNWLNIDRYKWCASCKFQGINESYYFDSYEQALEKRLELQKKIFLPFIRRHKKLFSKNLDIDYYMNFNRHIKFDHEQYVRDKFAGKKVNSYIMSILEQLGYDKKGRKIGVVFWKRCVISDKWGAEITFNGKRDRYYFNTYEKAVKKRLKLQEEIFMPFIRKIKDNLPESIDIDYYINLNSNIKFDPKQHEKDKMVQGRYKPVKKRKVLQDNI